MPPPTAHHWLLLVLVLQAEVEAYFAAQGYLFPHFHRFYWLGLNTSDWPHEGLPTFTWHDRSLGPNNATYEHWGL